MNIPKTSLNPEFLPKIREADGGYVVFRILNFIMTFKELRRNPGLFLLKNREKSAIISYYDGALRSGAFAYLNHKEELP